MTRLLVLSGRPSLVCIAMEALPRLNARSVFLFAIRKVDTGRRRMAVHRVLPRASCIGAPPQDDAVGIDPRARVWIVDALYILLSGVFKHVKICRKPGPFVAWPNHEA